MYSLQSVSDVGIAPTYFMGEDISAWNNTKIRHIEIVRIDYLPCFAILVTIRASPAMQTIVFVLLDCRVPHVSLFLQSGLMIEYQYDNASNLFLFIVSL